MDTVDFKAKDIVQAWREHQADMARRGAIGRVLEAIQEPAQAARVMEQAAEAAKLELDRIEAAKRDAESDVAQARKNAAGIVDKAHAQAASILTEADNNREKARDIVINAEVKATELIAKANGEAGTILTGARAEADQIARDHEEKKNRLIELEVDIANAERELAEINSQIDRIVERAKGR